MTEILELADNNFKAAMIKMFQWEIRNTFKTNEKWKMESLKKERTDIKKKMGLWELKNMAIEIKISVGGLDSRMEGKEERISELEDRRITITQSILYRGKIGWKKKEQS